MSETLVVEVVEETQLAIPTEEAEKHEVKIPKPDDRESRIKELLDKIYEIRKQKLMSFDALTQELNKRETELDVVIKALQGATDKTEVFKWATVIKGYGAIKQIMAERRYILQKLHLEEARLEKELYKIGATLG